LIESHYLLHPFRVKAATSASTFGTDGAVLASAAAHAAVMLPGSVEETSEAVVTPLPLGLLPQVSDVGADVQDHWVLITVNLDATEAVLLTEATPPNAYCPETSAVNE
jgi:hypothetical protein